MPERYTNITRRGRIRRGSFGVLSLAAAVAASRLLYANAAFWPAGLLTFPLFLAAMVGILQAYGST